MKKDLAHAEQEVLNARIKAERSILKDIEEQYEKALTEINLHVAQLLGRQDANLPHVIHQVEYQRMLKQQVQASLDKLHSTEYESVTEYLNESYTDAFVGTVYTLHHQDMPVILPINQALAVKAITLDTRLKKTMYEEMGKDINQLKKTIQQEITRGISSGMMYSDIAKNISNQAGIPMRRAKTIARTEGGRVQEQASYDAALQAKEKGAKLVKQWNAIRDGKTRDAHRALHNQTRELDEPFEIDGEEAMHPHDFGQAHLDCNCRCTMLTIAKAALDDDILKQMEADADFHNLRIKDTEKYGKAQVQNLGDFKQKYLKAAEETTETAPVIPPTIHPVQPETPPEPQQQPEPSVVEPPQPVQTSEPDQQTEPAFGKPAARSGKIDDVLSSEMAAAYDARMQDAPESVRNAHDRYRERIVFADAESKEHPHYALAEGGITIDLQRDLARDNGYAVFHEIGHNVDNNMHIDRTFTGSGKWGGDTQYGYSYTYGKNKFGKAIASDADKALEDFRLGIVKQHEDAEREARRTYDGSKTRSFLEMMGLSGDELETEMELDYRDHVRKTKAAAGLFGDPPSNRKDVEHSFARHISDTLSRSARRDISDMFESTFQYVDHPFGAGHGLDYWKQEDFLRPTEAFAEMYGASIASPESWEQIKRFFPTAVKVFEEMLEGLV